MDAFSDCLKTSDCTALQIAKLLIIPFVCLVEKLWLKRTFTSFSIFSIGLVVSGVSIV